MLLSFAIVLTSFLLCLFTVPFAIRLAIHLGAIDDPSRARKIHTRVVPRMGGLAIAFGFYIALALTVFFVRKTTGLDLARLAGLTVGGLLILCLGIYDDIFGADALRKFSVQFLAAGMLLLLGFSFDRIAIPWGGELEIGRWGHLIAVLWVVGITNAINLIDGLDGLASGVALIVVCALATVSAMNGEVMVMHVTLALAGALLGFLIYNYHPAKIFMGDTGSLFVGFIVATTGLMTNTKSSTTVVSLIPVIGLGFPIIDTLLAALRRISQARSPFSSDREHIHHRLLKMGFTHQTSVLLLWGFSVLACAIAIAISFTRGDTSAWILSGFAVFILIVIHRLGYLRPDQILRDVEEGRVRSQEYKKKKNIIESVMRVLPGQNSYNAVFEILEPIHALHGYQKAELEVFITDTLKGPVKKTMTFSWLDAETSPLDDEPLKISFNLQTAKFGQVGRVSYYFRDRNTQLDPDNERLMMRIHRGILSAILRLREQEQLSMRKKLRVLSPQHVE